MYLKRRERFFTVFLSLFLTVLITGCSKEIPDGSGRPEHVILAEKANDYLEKHLPGKAIKFLRKAEKLDTDYPPTYYLLGRAYMYEKKFELADEQFDIFKEKMKAVPKTDRALIDYYVAALKHMAYLHATMKKYAKSAEECKEIIKFQPEDQRAHYNLAVCYYIHYRNRPRAFGELKKVTEINPNTHIAARAKFYIDYLRRNPDPRFIGDFSFIEEKEEYPD